MAPSSDAEYVYKICPADIWQKAQDAGMFNGAGIDLNDGFIHFSTADQVAETAHLHFHQVTGLVLVKVSTKGLDLVWEESRGGQLFPHLYEVLAMSFVDHVFAMELDDEGRHILPPEITPL